MVRSSLPESFTPQLMRQLELLRIHTRRSFLGSRQGGHLSLKRGHGIEFSDYRKYELGDNPRHIDWGVYGRTDRLYVKRFQEEQDIHILIVLDASASMFTPAHERKWERARDITLAIAYIALMQQDSVSVSVLGNFHSPKLYGGRALYSLNSQLSAVMPPRPADNVRPFDFSREVTRAASRIRFPGIAIVVSDFLMEISTIRQSMLSLLAKNLEISAIQVLSDEDINPLPSMEGAVAEDSETGDQMVVSLVPEAREQYQQLFNQHASKLSQFFANHHISQISTRSSLEFQSVIAESLPQLGLFRGH